MAPRRREASCTSGSVKNLALALSVFHAPLHPRPLLTNQTRNQTKQIANATSGSLSYPALHSWATVTEIQTTGEI